MGIAEIVSQLNGVLNTNTSKSLEVPSPLLLLSKNRNGLSAREMARDVIIRQSQAGAPVGLLEDGSDSISEKMERIRMEVIVEHLLKNGKISITIPPGSIQIASAGVAAPGFPVTTNGYNITPTFGYGIIQ